MALLFLLPSLLVGVALSSSASPRPAQASPSDGVPPAEAPPARPAAFEGVVYGPDGLPAAEAVVVSSAGGRAVTDVAGSYRLESEVPLDAATVQITAFGAAGGGLIASTSVALSAGAASTRVDPLALARGTTCSPAWIPTFGGQPGANGDIKVFAVHDDGSGPALYVGGEFEYAGGVAVNHVAKWDGNTWSALGTGLEGGAGSLGGEHVSALVTYDDGNGPALYAGGGFQIAAGVPVKNIAKWDGSSWSALGSSSGPNSSVFALTVYDDGGGSDLYVGGAFTIVGGVEADRIARWNGSTWSRLGGGRSNTVYSLAVFDDGNGPELYAGGSPSNHVNPNGIGKWNGSWWTPVGTGVFGSVNALAVFDDGNGPALYAGGSLTMAGTVPLNGIARWDGATWSAVGGGVASPDGGSVYELMVYDDGSGPALHAGGEFTSAGGEAARNVARWDGESWSALGEGTSSDVRALAGFDPGTGLRLYASGAPTSYGEEASPGFRAWDGSTWSLVGDGLDDFVDALAVHDDGSGMALYASGGFKLVGGISASSIAKWDGFAWSALGSGLVGDGADALAVFDDGGGPALFAAGGFGLAGDVPALRIAKWDGSTWSALGSGLSGDFNPGVFTNAVALAVYDDGSGAALYVGGSFTHAGGGAASGIARWDGSSWSSVGGGFAGNSATGPYVNALAVYDDGAGPALYAGGDFTSAGGVPLVNLARWDGSSWSPVGGFANRVSALAVYDDGTAPALYAAGSFSSVPGGSANNVAKWDGSSWSALGSGTNGYVARLGVHDDGNGPALYAGGGSFTEAGGMAANRIAKWDGSTWSALGSGLEIGFRGLATYDDGMGPALYIGGRFPGVEDSGDSYLAKWGCDRLPPTLSCPEAIRVAARYGTSGRVVNYSVAVSDAVDPDPVLQCDPPSGSFFPIGTTMVTCTATDAAGNETSCDFPVTVSVKVRAR